MVYKPRTTDEIYTSLRGGLTRRIAKLTNFVETSFNYIWTQAFSSRFRENEVALLASQMSGWVDYAGGPITDDDLNSLGIDGVSAAEVNEYMSDEDLDQLIEIVGTDRGPGQEAKGQVTFNTVSSYTQIQEGTAVATQPDSNGDFFEYTTDTNVETASGETSVSVPITAIDVGEEYNVGSGQITYLPSPPTGVQGVSNTEAILGGDNIETNDELRERAKNAIFDTSGGGTANGVRGFVRSNTKDVTSVSVAEYPGGNASLKQNSPSPGGPGSDTDTAPFADVIVEGGETGAIKESINEARPVSIQHNLVRPALIEISIDIVVSGTNISTSDIQSSVTSYINGRGLGEDIIKDKIVQRTLNADEQVEGIDTLDITISSELIVFDSTQDIYLLNKGVQMTTDGITEVTGQLSGNSTTFTEDTDYQEIDNDTDGSDDSIDWSLTGDTPDDGTNFFVTYAIGDDIPIDNYEKGDTDSVSVSVL